MAIYIVTWNLNREGDNYPAARAAFIEQLERHTHVADSGLESVRFVSSSLSAEDLYLDLQPKIDDDDRVFVVQLASSKIAGQLEDDVIDWIEARL